MLYGGDLVADRRMCAAPIHLHYHQNQSVWSRHRARQWLAVPLPTGLERKEAFGTHGLASQCTPNYLSCTLLQATVKFSCAVVHASQAVLFEDPFPTKRHRETPPPSIAVCCLNNGCIVALPLHSCLAAR